MAQTMRGPDDAARLLDRLRAIQRPIITAAQPVAASARTSVESSPPDRKAPTGTSATICRSTAFCTCACTCCTA